jgi:heme oxygenase
MTSLMLLPASPTAGLADTLRARVGALHTEAERSGIVSDVLRGEASVRAYLLLLRNLLPAYQALEAGLERHRDAALLGDLVRPELYRSGAILSDVTAMSAEWRQELMLLPQATAYEAAITACAEGDGRRLIAHAYARYLGDLNGGGVLQRRLAGTLHFHAFPAIAEIASYRVEYRSAIDRAGARLADWSDLAAEAAQAFRYNIELSCAVKAKEELLF